MSVFGRALAYLKELETILNGGVADIDLRQLRADTLAINGTDMPDHVVKQWSEVLLAVSPTLYNYGRELARVHIYLQGRRSSLLMLQRIVWSLETMVILISTVSVGSICKAAAQTTTKFAFAGTAVSIGMITTFSFFMFGLLSAWSASMNEMYRKLLFQQNSPLNSVLLRYADLMSSRFIVMLTAAVATGRDVRTEVITYAKNVEAGNVASRAFANCQSAGGGSVTTTCDLAGLDACNLVSQYSVSNVGSFVKAYCPPALAEIADGLIDMLDGGIERYIQSGLWRDIDAGVNMLRMLVLLQYDTGSDASSLTPDVIQDIVAKELAPILMLKGAQFSRAVSTANSDLVAAGLVESEQQSEGPGAESRCFQQCMVSSPSCKVALYDPSKSVCFKSSDISAFSPGGALVWKGVGQGGLSVYMAKDKITDTFPVSPTLLNSAQAGAAYSSTMLDHSTYLAKLITAVLRRHQFLIEIETVRLQLDQVLSNYYGDDVYLDAISSAVDTVLRRVEDLVQSERRNSSTMIDADRLLAKLKALPSEDIRDMYNTLYTMSESAVQHRNMFPPYRSVATTKVTKTIIVLGGLTLVNGYTIYAILLYAMLMFHKSAKSESSPMTLTSMIQRLVVSLCALVVTLFVIQTLATKTSVKSEHNMDMIDMNGERLTEICLRTPGLLTEVWNGNFTSRPAALDFVNQSALLIELYDKCNSVTIGQVSVPPPYSELLMYGIIAGLFLIMTGVTIYHIDPEGKVDNLRMLYALINRVKQGDVTAITEAEHVLECARPSADIWSFFIWYGIMLLVVVTVWFVIQSRVVVNDYEDSLALRSDCL